VTLAVRTKVLGHDWIVYFLPAKEFKRRFGGDCLGVAECDDRKISILANRNFKLETLVHELHHAYLGEMCVDVANLSGDQMEEVCSDLIARYGARLLKQADDILLRYQKLKAKTRTRQT
jgi:hypothetical protein